MSPHVMFVEGVLSHRVEQRNFLKLLLRKIANGVVSHSIVELDLFNHFFGQEFFICGDLIDLRWIIKPAWCSWIE